MSGGYFDYEQFRISDISDKLYRRLREDFKYYCEYTDREEDKIDTDGNEKYREEIKRRIKSLADNLKYVSDELHKLDLFLSGDRGYKAYLEVE